MVESENPHVSVGTHHPRNGIEFAKGHPVTVSVGNHVAWRIEIVGPCLRVTFSSRKKNRKSPSVI